jgi:hypothetical protein
LSIVKTEERERARRLRGEEGLPIKEIESFWLESAGLPLSSLRTSTVNVYSRYSARKRRNMLPYGTCRVTVSRTAVTQHIFGAIQEYAGFRRDAWLE